MIDDVLGKSVMVAFIIAATIYNRIAGIVALILVIALLNQNPTKEGLTFDKPSPAPISFNSSDEFRQKYCLKGVSDPATPPTNPQEYSYMLSPTMFTDDASGNPQIRPGFAKFIDFKTFNAGNGCKLDPTTKNYITILNMCDPTCNWATLSTAPTTAPSTMPTTDPAIPSLPNTTEGFNPMSVSALRPHIRTGRHLVTDGAANVKSVANRLKRQLF